MSCTPFSPLIITRNAKGLMPIYFEAPHRMHAKLNLISSMAQRGPEVPSTPPNTWWDAVVHANNPFSYAPLNRWPPPSNRYYETDAMTTSVSNASATSFTNNASCSRSALSMDSSSADGLSGEPAMENNHLWNQLLQNVGNDAGEVGNSQNDAEDFLHVLNSRSLAMELCRDLKMEGGTWEPHRPSLNYPDRCSSSYNVSIAGPANSLSDLVVATNWTIAPPSSHFGSSITPPPPSGAFIGAASTTDHFAPGFISPVIKHESPAVYSAIAGESSGSYADRESAAAAATASSAFTEHGNSAPEFPNWIRLRNLSDQVSPPFSCCSEKPDPMEVRASKPCVESELFAGSKQGYEISSSMKGNRRSTGTQEVKKKRSAESEEMQPKKTKNDNTVVDSSTKLQAPKVKIAEKISALQQLVSPFGKTDQASVLMDTINYIKILQKQVQLLTGPYLKSSVSKDRSSWGEMERKEKADGKHDLRNKGLCLVPISSIPQPYRDSSRPDYWMPTFRACFYR